jgi:hypothetical protein
MPYLVKCKPDGINHDMNIFVSTESGKLPDRNPKGFIPRDRDRVFLWAIPKHGGNGLAERGLGSSFRQDGKDFRLRVLDAEPPIRAFGEDDLHDKAAEPEWERNVKLRFRRNAHASVVELSEPEAAYLDQFYCPAPAYTRSGAPEPGNNGDGPTDLLEDVDEVRNDPSLDETTRERLIHARLGQGRFRDDVMRRWRGACAVTGCSQPEILRASHIRPWRNSSNEQRLNPANGILLAANLDALFDHFMISFNDDGQMLTSCRLEDSCSELFGLPAPLRSELTDRERGFLAYHRDRLQR